ncbi:MAG: CYCXC family (seleno)protein [Thermodesulfobacteriota bacterium]
MPNTGVFGFFKGRRYIPALAAVAALFVLASCKASTTEPAPAAALRGGETRATLSPAYFGGSVAEAYRVAEEIPEVLDSLHCYCDCKRHSGHKSLLTCYVDTHAAYCDICMEEAFMAYDMHKKGADIPTIRKAVDERFSRAVQR